MGRRGIWVFDRCEAVSGNPTQEEYAPGALAATGNAAAQHVAMRMVRQLQVTTSMSA